MGGLEVTPARRKRERKRRTAQERRWAAKAGPVKVYYREPDAANGEKQFPAKAEEQEGN